MVRLEQISLINSIHANAVVLHRNLNLELILAASGGLDRDKDGALLVRKLDGVRYQIDQYLLDAQRVQLTNFLLYLIAHLQFDIPKARLTF